MLQTRAYAKLNLSLEIVGRRPDGYHELVSVMTLVNVADTIEILASERFELECSDSGLAGPENLVSRSAAQFMSTYGIRNGCRILLDKRIPSSAGLGGGSSDAAATLVALDRFWQTGASCVELLALSEQLGSDVPFFLYGGTALVEGRGEIVTRLQEPETTWYVLVKPPVAASTTAVFAELQPDEWTSGDSTRELACSITRTGHPGIGVNALQGPLFRLFPEAKRCFDAVNTLAPGRTFVTGSGPTVAAMFGDRDSAQEAARLLAQPERWIVVCSSRVAQAWEAPCA